MLEHKQLIEEYQILKREYVNTEITKDAKALIEKKQEQIERLEELLRKYKKELNLLNYAERAKLLTKSSIVCYFLNKTNITPNWKVPKIDKWSALMKTYEQYMPLATIYMNRVNLSWQEKCTCILVHLDFSTNNIAMLLEKSNSRISNVKKNASKKLFGDEEGQKLRQRLAVLECESENNL
jgi:hypothetical protein